MKAFYIRVKFRLKKEMANEFDKNFLSWSINTIIKNSNITLLIVQLKNNFGLLNVAEVIFQYFS